MSRAVLGLVVLGTDPARSRGGIAAVLPGYFRLLDRLQIPFRFIPTHSTDRWSGKLRHWVLAPFRVWFAVGQLRKMGVESVAIYAHAGKWPSLVRKLSLLLAGRLVGAKGILHIHGAEIESYFQRPLMRRLCLLTLRPWDRIFVLSPYWRRLLLDSLPAERLRVVPNPLSWEIESEAKRPPASSGWDEHRILVLSRLVPGKGLDLAVEALGELPKEYRLVVGGEGGLLQPLKDLAQHRGVAHRVEFAGWVTGPAKTRLLETSAVFCLPTRRDCMSTSILEALAFGLPVVALDYGPTADLVPSGRCGLLASCSDPRELAQAIRSICESPELRRSMSMEAKQWVHSQFCIESAIPRLREGLRDMDGEDRAGA